MEVFVFCRPILVIQIERYSLSNRMFVIFKCLCTKVKMAGKEKEKHVRRWTKEEVEKFAEVLADLVNGLAFCLDRLALMK